jgi:hypothetical protein
MPRPARAEAQAGAGAAPAEEPAEPPAAGAAAAAAAATAAPPAAAAPPTADPAERARTVEEEAAEAALRSFWAAAVDVFRLAVLLPLKHLIVGPLVWALTRVGLLGTHPDQVLRRLEAENASAPMEPWRLAGALAALNRRHPEAVVEVRRGSPRGAPLGSELVAAPEA